MVKCTNGISVIEVTEGAYNTIFKDQGYRPIAEVNKKPYKAKEPIVKPAVNEVPETKVEPTEPVEENELGEVEEIEEDIMMEDAPIEEAEEIILNEDDMNDEI